MWSHIFIGRRNRKKEVRKRNINKWRGKKKGKRFLFLKKIKKTTTLIKQKTKNKVDKLTLFKSYQKLEHRVTINVFSKLW